jgi:hypothetical protein
MFKPNFIPTMILSLVVGSFFIQDAEAFLTKKMKARQEARKEGRAAKKECKANGGSGAECRAVKRATKQASKAASGVFSAKKTARLQARSDGNFAKAECKAAGQAGCNKLKRAVKNESKAASGLFSGKKTERFLKRADRLRGKFDAKNPVAEEPVEGEEGMEDEYAMVDAPVEAEEYVAEVEEGGDYAVQSAGKTSFGKAMAIRGRYNDQLENRNLAANMCANQGGVFKMGKCQFGQVNQFGRGAQGRSMGGIGFAGRGNSQVSAIGMNNGMQGRSAFRNPDYQAYAQGRMAQRMPAQQSRFAQRPLVEAVESAEEPVEMEMEEEAEMEESAE